MAPPPRPDRPIAGEAVPAPRRVRGPGSDERLSSRGTRPSRSPLPHRLDPYPRDARADEADLGGRRLREVDHAALREGAAIVNAHEHALARAQVLDLGADVERQRLVGGGVRAVCVEALAVRGLLAVVRRAVQEANDLPRGSRASPSSARRSCRSRGTVPCRRRAPVQPCRSWRTREERRPREREGKGESRAEDALALRHESISCRLWIGFSVAGGIRRDVRSARTRFRSWLDRVTRGPPGRCSGLSTSWSARAVRIRFVSSPRRGCSRPPGSGRSS